VLQAKWVFEVEIVLSVEVVLSVRAILLSWPSKVAMVRETGRYATVAGEQETVTLYI
jgi:hypothetical protein